MFPFLADQNFTGGLSLSRSQTVDLSEANNPAPAAAYQTLRYDGNSTTFTYTFANLTPNTGYTLRLHLAETLYDKTGHLLNVTVNGTTILSNFDIFGVMGTDYKAIVQSYNVTTDANGTLAVRFQASNSAAEVCAIEVLSGSNANPLPAPTGVTIGQTWNAVAGATGYIVQNGPTPSGPFIRLNPTLLTSLSYHALIGGYFRVIAVNASGAGEPSVSVIASPFALAANAAAVTVNRGGTAAATITATTASLTNQVGISLAVTGLPQGVHALCFPNTFSLLIPVSAPAVSGLLPYSASSSLDFDVDATAAAGTYPITVTGMLGAFTTTTLVTLTVK